MGSVAIGGIDGGTPLLRLGLVGHSYEVLTRLHHEKNKNKIIECLPDIEPWLAG